MSAMTPHEDCGGEVEQWYSTTGAANVGACTKCGATVVQSIANLVAPDNYAGTGMTLVELEQLDALRADELLMRVLFETRAQMAQLAQIDSQAASLLRERIRARGSEDEPATMAASDHYEARLAKDTKWTYDLEVLTDLQKYISPDDFDRALVYIPPSEPTRQPNKTELNKLKKRGGEVKAVIEAGCIEHTTYGKLEVVRRKR